VGVVEVQAQECGADSPEAAVDGGGVGYGGHDDPSDLLVLKSQASLWGQQRDARRRTLCQASIENLVNGLIKNRGRAKPWVLDFDDWLPLNHFYDRAQQLSEKIWVGNSCGSSEGIGLSLMVDLDWALHAVDKTWFKTIDKFLNRVLGLFVTDY